MMKGVDKKRFIERIEEMKTYEDDKYYDSIIYKLDENDLEYIKNMFLEYFTSDYFPYCFPTFFEDLMQIEIETFEVEINLKNKTCELFLFDDEDDEDDKMVEYFDLDKDPDKFFRRISSLSNIENI